MFGPSPRTGSRTRECPRCFTLGGVDEALDPHVRVGLALDSDSTVHGVTSGMPVHASGGGEPVGCTLDVMR